MDDDDVVKEKSSIRKATDIVGALMALTPIVGMPLAGLQLGLNYMNDEEDKAREQEAKAYRNVYKQAAFNEERLKAKYGQERGKSIADRYERMRKNKEAGPKSGKPEAFAATYEALRIEQAEEIESAEKELASPKNGTSVKVRNTSDSMKAIEAVYKGKGLKLSEDQKTKLGESMDKGFVSGGEYMKFAQSGIASPNLQRFQAHNRENDKNAKRAKSLTSTANFLKSKPNDGLQYMQDLDRAEAMLAEADQLSKAKEYVPKTPQDLAGNKERLEAQAEKHKADIAARDAALIAYHNRTNPDDQRPENYYVEQRTKAAAEKEAARNRIIDANAKRKNEERAEALDNYIKTVFDNPDDRKPETAPAIAAAFEKYKNRGGSHEGSHNEEGKAVWKKYRDRRDGEKMRDAKNPPPKAPIAEAAQAASNDAKDRAAQYQDLRSSGGEVNPVASLVKESQQATNNPRRSEGPAVGLNTNPLSFNVNVAQGNKDPEVTNFNLNGNDQVKSFRDQFNASFAIYDAKIAALESQLRMKDNLSPIPVSAARENRMTA